jgi:hypothetical protein
MRLPRMHKSTILFLILVAVILLLANIPGRLVSVPGIRSCNDGKYGPHFGCVEDLCRHGWPSSFLLREPTQLPTSPFWRLSVWRLSEGITGWSWWALATDVVAGFAVLLLAGGAFELWRRRRGRLQICLIDVFVIFTLVACGFAYWATLASERDRQARVVEQLKRAEATSDAEVEWSRGGPSWLRKWLGDKPFAVGDRVIGICLSNEGFASLTQLRSLEVVCFSGSFPISDGDMKVIGELPELKALDLCMCGHESDESGENGFPRDETIQLPPLPHLRGLNLYDAAFYGDGLEYLRDIEVLDLTGTEIGDDAMPKFETTRNLKSLSLAGTKITDAGLRHLKGLTQLRELWLGSDDRPEKVTAEGIKRLQQALPNCKIN